MPTDRIPLVGSFNQRGIDGDAALTLSEDQRFLNCVFNVVQNPVTGKATVYVEKRPGWGVDSQVSSGLASTGLLKPQAFNAALSAFGDTNSKIYVGTVDVGNITGRAIHFSETLVSNSSNVLMRSSDGTGWYYVEGAKDVTAYTGHTSSGTFNVSTLSSTDGFFVGQLVSGNTIGSGARVSSITASTSTIGLTVASTADSTGVAITKEPVAKIIDTDFVSTGTYISNFAPMDGYVFYATDDGYINNSDLNSITAYSVNSRLAVQMSPDPPIAVATQKNAIVVFGLASKEVFSNAGLASGSPLQRVQQAFDKVGCLDQRSVTQIENEIYFVSSPYEGDLGVYRIREFQAQKVSTPNVDRIIGTAARNGTIYASSFRLSGYPYAAFFVSIASETADNLLLESGDFLLLESNDNILLESNPSQTASFVRLLVYNTQLNIWGEWDCDEATFIDSIGAGTANQLIATSRVNTSGKVYKIDPVSDGALYQDDGSSYSMEIRTSKIDHGTDRKKYVEEVSLIADTISTAAASTASLYWSDDDYQSWKGPLNFDLTKDKKSVTRLGAHNGGRAYKVVHSANAALRAQALEIKYRIGLS